MFEVSIENLKKVFMDFYNLTKFKIVLFDSERKLVYSYPETMCNFCKMVRSEPILAKKCLLCDNIGFDICDKTKKAYIYKCHMSIIEAIAPIYYNDINIGYLMFGQILGPDTEDVKKQAKSANETYGIELTEKMINEMKVADEDYINSAVNMMSMCANYLYTSRIVRNIPNMLFYQIKEYIKTNLNGDISIESVCSHFYISRTKLYTIFMENVNMGMSDYIREKRIKQAKNLIINTDNSIAQIAASVGICDVNYFIRIFKKYEGITPLQYRKNFGK